MNIENLQSLMLNDNGFAFDPISGESFQFTESGVMIIRLLIDGENEAGVVSRLRDEYEVTRSVAERDFEMFLLSMKECKLVSEE